MATGKIQRTVMSGSLPYFQDVLTGLTSPTAIVIVPTLPGDYNQNGTVDAADYVIWRKTGGSTDDYNAWRAHFGQTFSFGSGLGVSAASQPMLPAVPEPATLVLMMLAATGWCLRRGRST
jgi:PEP-CTERM motif